MAQISDARNRRLNSYNSPSGHDSFPCLPGTWLSPYHGNFWLALKIFPENNGELYRGFSTLRSVHLFNSCDVSSESYLSTPNLTCGYFRLNSRQRRKTTDAENTHTVPRMLTQDQTTLRPRSLHSFKKVCYFKTLSRCLHAQITPSPKRYLIYCSHSHELLTDTFLLER